MRIKKILGLLIIFTFFIIMPKTVLGATKTVNKGEKLTIKTADLTVTPSQYAGTNNMYFSVEKTSWKSSNNGIVKITSSNSNSITVEGINAGNATITCSGKNIVRGYIEEATATITIQVRDLEAEKQNNVQNAQKEIDETNEAYKTEPGENADAKTIKNFVMSDQKFNSGKNILKVNKDKSKKWLETVKAFIATDPSHYNQKNQYGGVRDALEELVTDGKVSNNTQNNLNNTYDLTNESNQRILAAYKAAAGEDRSKRDVFNDDVLTDISEYDPSKNPIDPSSASKIETATSKILTVISNIGMAVSVIMLAILGIKYMLGSVEEKAEYKEGLIPYVIGAFILFGITGFVKILMAIGDKIGNI